MKDRRSVVYAWLLCTCLTVGCSQSNPTGIAAGTLNTSGGQTVVREPDAELGRDDLEGFINLKLGGVESGWNFESKDDHPLVGTWRSEDGADEPIVVRPDGTIELGFLWSEGNGRIAVGIFAFDEQGRVAAVASHGATRLGVSYKLEDDGKLYGARGPTPRVAWKRVSRSVDTLRDR